MIRSLVGEALGELTERLYSGAPPQARRDRGHDDARRQGPGMGRGDPAGTGPQDRGRPAIRCCIGSNCRAPAPGTDLLLAPIRATDKEPRGSLAGYIKRLRRERQRQLERVRLLYVAATRARSALHLLGCDCSLQSTAGQRDAPAQARCWQMLWALIASSSRSSLQASTSIAATASTSLSRIQNAATPAAITGDCGRSPAARAFNGADAWPRRRRVMPRSTAGSA